MIMAARRPVRRDPALHKSTDASRATWLSALGELFAHQRAHGLVAEDAPVGRLFVPRLERAAVGDVAEPFIERAGSRVDLLHAQLGPAKAAPEDALLRPLDKEG